MKSLSLFVLSLLLAVTHSGFSQVNLKNLGKDISNAVNTGKSGNLSNTEVVNGLKEALNVGTGNSVKKSSANGGFYNNPKIKIPFPQECIDVKKTLVNVGMKPTVDKFEKTLNNAAEVASKEATPIFTNAIGKMNISDGMTILRGKDDEATQYLKKTTSAELKVKFKPVVQNATRQVELLKYWKPIIEKYNKVSPFLGSKKVNPDLDAYVTEKAIEGLFTLVAEEEAKIRKDPAARVTDLLKKVFAK